MNFSNRTSMTERIESLKAGTLSALSVTLVYIAIAVASANGAIPLGNDFLLPAQVDLLRDFQIGININLFVKVAMAFLSGFLFGVTYRYIIRDDDNPHLKSGAVLAFGLVRGLALIEGEDNFFDSFWLLGILVIESIIYFAIARFTLDWAISHNWLKPFTSN
jgi:hypothetical protein